MPEDRAEYGDEDPRRRKEATEMVGMPHVDGLARGTVVEYDDWQWGVVTEIAEETDPTKVGFVLVDELGDWVVRDLEEARGCWEHYEAVRTFRDGEHEYWTSAEYIQKDDMWEVLGPIHPDARDEPELATDGGVDQSEAGVEREEATECEGCDGFVRFDNSDPYYKTADDRFWHAECVPEGVDDAE